MQVVILCGGQGTRAYPYTQKIPKALMTVGGVPIVEQVMRIYAAHGFREFILSCGYLKEAIFEHFEASRVRQLGWDVQCVDTGATADTGDRIYKLRHLLRPTFLATYCDGLGDVDLQALVAFHHQHGGLATLTAAPLRSQYGLIYSDGNSRVTGFDEKPVLPDFWINGGFFVFERAVFDGWEGHNLEKDILPTLAARGELHLYRHRGFWRSMDTYKDQQELNALWAPYAEAFTPLPPAARETQPSQAVDTAARRPTVVGTA
ncbi:MAG TPA: sugar phosphate nucleotidyltransferase [Chloroflexota bacterium]|nr:sugar phosphate nucleotidyltransferase [Chloroflexota bacterium]